MLARPSRARLVPAILTFLSISAAEATGQNLYVSATDPTSLQLWTVTPARVGTRVVFGPGMNGLYSHSAFEVDQRTGDVLIAHKASASSEIKIYRTTIAGSTAVSQVELLTVPGTQANVPQYLYRESNGGFLLLSYVNSAIPDYKLHRIGVTMTGGISFELPYLDVPGALPLTDIASDVAGNIYATGPRLGGTSEVWVVPPTGGTPAVVPTLSSNNMTFYSLETTVAGSVIVAGAPRLPGRDPSLICSRTSSNTAYNAAVDLHRQADGMFLLVDNVPGGSDVRLFDPSTCGGAGGGGFPWVAPSNLLLYKVTRAETVPSKIYGSPCPTSAGTTPIMTELLPPRIGSVWSVGLTVATPSTPSALYVGVSEIPPVPIGGTCAVFMSADLRSPTIGTDAAGAAMFNQAIPPDPRLFGFRMFAQWAVFDTAAPAGFAVSSALATTVTF